MHVVIFLFLIWAIMAVVMGLLWLYQKGVGNAGIVDLGWTGGVGIAVLLAAWLGDGPELRRVLIGGLGAIWSIRLCLYIWRDRVHRKSEDPRYASLRQRWGEQADRIFFWFFQMQALLVLIFAIPAIIGAGNPAPAPSGFDLLGVVLFVVSISGESLADRQLMQFRSRPENSGITCRAGLWRYSRHPNYFFEWLHWWAYPCFAVGSPYWPITLVGPAVMLYFLFRVTGIPATEARALQSRGDDYRAYQQTTSVFFPWFPRGNRAPA